MKRHSKKYILEAIAYWKKQLKKLDETASWGLLPAKFAKSVSAMTETELFALFALLVQSVDVSRLQAAVGKARTSPTAEVASAVEALSQS